MLFEAIYIALHVWPSSTCVFPSSPKIHQQKQFETYFLCTIWYEVIMQHTPILNQAYPMTLCISSVFLACKSFKMVHNLHENGQCLHWFLSQPVTLLVLFLHRTMYVRFFVPNLYAFQLCTSLVAQSVILMICFFSAFLPLNFGRWWGSMDDIIEVFLGFLLLNFGRWWGFLNDIFVILWIQVDWRENSRDGGALKSYLP